MNARNGMSLAGGNQPGPMNIITHESITASSTASKSEVQFDYSALSPENRVAIEGHTREIRERLRTAKQDIMEIGQRLIAVKDSLPHGEFGHWLAAEFEWSESSATKMMQVATTFKSVTVTDLPINVKSLYLLAAPSTPEPIRARFLEQAKAGNPVQHRDVHRAVRDAAYERRNEQERRLRQLREEGRITATQYHNARHDIVYSHRDINVEALASQKPAKRKVVPATPAKPEVPAVPQRHGLGTQHAYDAINCLKKILPNDPLRADGMQTVARWINDNGHIGIAVPVAAIRSAAAMIFETAQPGGDRAGLMAAIAQLREALASMVEVGR